MTARCRNLTPAARGTATPRPSAGPDGLPLTSGAKLRRPRAMPTHPHNSDDPHSGRAQIPTAPANATWAHNHDTHPADPAPRTARRTSPQVGPRTELGRYTVPAGERVLYGQRVDGIVRLVDRPVAPGGRAYLIERGLETKGELDALIADYRATAQRLQAIPMSESPVDHFLEHTG
jgi:hypothetical protein